MLFLRLSVVSGHVRNVASITVSACFFGVFFGRKSEWDSGSHFGGPVTQLDDAEVIDIVKWAAKGPLSSMQSK